jgi:pterin-4a-carbinolamine dehydratase
MSAKDLGELADHTTSREKVSTDDQPGELAALGARWSLETDELRLSLPGVMTRTGAVAAYAGTLADELDHHPKIVLEHAGLVLSLHTHDSQQLTVLDLVYAARLEQWLRANGWPA